MSKYVKQLITDSFKNRLNGVSSLMLVTLTGLNAKTVHTLRGALAEKGIQMMVIKNSLARRATEGMPLAAGFSEMQGMYALCWGANDIVALAKEVVRLSKDKAYKGFDVRGAVIDGEAYDPAAATEVSKWPTREEQISILLGQVMGVGSTLSGQLIAMGGALASQIKQLAEKEGEAPAAETPDAE